MRAKPGFSHEYQGGKDLQICNLHVKLLAYASVRFYLTCWGVSCALALDWRKARNWWWLYLNIKLLKSMEILCITELSICCFPSILTLFWYLLKCWFCNLHSLFQPQIAMSEPVSKTKLYPVPCLWCILILHKLDGMSDGICSAAQAIQEGQAADSGISGLKGWRLLEEHCVSELSVTSNGPFSLDSKNNCFHWKNNRKNTHLRKKTKKVTWEGVWGMRNPFLTTW